MNTKHALTLKGFAALLLGVTVVASSCKKNDSDLMDGPNGMSDSSLAIGTGEKIMATSAISGSLLVETNFETSDFLSAWDWTELPNSGLIKQSTEQVRSGKYSAKFELSKSDPDIGGSKRLELARSPYSTPGGEHWYGMSINLPTSYIADPNEEVLFQLHATADDGEGHTSPPVALQTKDGRWRMQILWDSRAINTSQNWSNVKIIDLGAYEKGAWTDWVFHIKSSYQTDGLIEIWKNGKLVATYNGPNNYNDKVGNFLKMGIYKWGWKEGIYSTTTKRTLYFDEIRIGNQNSSYEDVAPNLSSATPTTPTAPTEPATTEPAPTEVTPTPVTNSAVFAVNAGGIAFKASNGITYQADKNYSGGGTSRSSAGIFNTTDDVLYQSERYGTFGYNVPVQNGTYLVTFKFAEYWQKASGKRQFDILAENRTVVSNLDIFAVIGYNKAYDVTREVTVNDGILNLNFKSDIGSPKISAFHVIKK